MPRRQAAFSGVGTFSFNMTVCLEALISCSSRLPRLRSVEANLTEETFTSGKLCHPKLTSLEQILMLVYKVLAKFKDQHRRMQKK